MKLDLSVPCTITYAQFLLSLSDEQYSNCLFTNPNIKNGQTFTLLEITREYAQLHYPHITLT